MFEYEFPMPALTVDMVVVREDHAHICDVLLIERANDPFKGQLALPGGFVDSAETVEEAAQRELHEETNLWVPLWKMKMVGVFSKPGRDPRGWTVSHCFVTKGTKFDPRAGDDAANLKWVSYNLITSYPELLAFDHAEMVGAALLLARY